MRSIIIMHEKSTKNIKIVYFIKEDWCNRGEPGEAFSPVFSSIDKTDSEYQKILNSDDTKELINEILSRNITQSDKEECVDISENSYECWVDGDWYDNHYRIAIETLVLDDSFDINELIDKITIK